MYNKGTVKEGEQTKRNLGGNENERKDELFEIVNANAEMMGTNRMTTDEILENIHCGVDEEGENVDLDTGKPTGIWYEEVEY